MSVDEGVALERAREEEEKRRRASNVPSPKGDSSSTKDVGGREASTNTKKEEAIPTRSLGKE